LYAEFVGVTRQGPPCQMMVNVRDDDTLVTLLNHTTKDWNGKVIFQRKRYPAVDEVRDPIQDHAYPKKLVQLEPETVTVQVRIPACEIKVLAFGPKRTTKPFTGPVTTTSGATEEDAQFLEQIKQKGPKAVLGTV